MPEPMTEQELFTIDLFLQKYAEHYPPGIGLMMRQLREEVRRLREALRQIELIQDKAYRAA